MLIIQSLRYDPLLAINTSLTVLTRQEKRGKSDYFAFKGFKNDNFLKLKQSTCRIHNKSSIQYIDIKTGKWKHFCDYKEKDSQTS